MLSCCLRQSVSIFDKVSGHLPALQVSVINILGYHHRMASSEGLQRAKARADETDKILADLQSQIAAIRQVAVKQAGLGEEARLLKENEELKLEIESLKKALAVAEIEHGVRQVPIPTKGAIAALKAQPQPVPQPVNGAVEVKEEVKPDKAGGQKKKNQNQEKGAAAEPKKAKSGTEKKEGKGDKEDKAAKGGKGQNAGGDAKPKKAAAGGAGDNANAPIDISRLDMRVGKIIAVEKHPNADSLYVEQVDLGEDKPRTIVSGLVKHVPINAMKERIAVFMCNLKPAAMRGVTSQGMIMCAVGPEKTEILVPPTDSVIGDRVIVEEYPGTPDALLNPKKKIWETLKPDVRTNSERVATYKGAPLVIPGKGKVVAPTLADSQIS